MKIRRWMLGLFALLTIAADADGGADTGDAGPDAEAPKGPPAYDAAPFPEEKSSRPQFAEWKGKDAVSVAIQGLPSDCSALRIREWLRIHCSGQVASVGLVGGERTDVFASLEEIREDFEPNTGELVFAVRRGDRRLFEWLRIEFGYQGMTSTGTMFILSEVWLPGDDKPTLIAR